MQKLKRKYVREKYFNLYIRLRDTNIDGYGVCVTCGKRIHYKEGQAGHFAYGYDFDETNQHLQCVACNMYKSGNLGEYTIWMIKKYGQDHVEWLLQQKKGIHKYGQPRLREIRDHYKPIIKELKREKGEI